jgi:hypothetical protein
MKNNLSATMVALAPLGAMADVAEPARAVRNNCAPGDVQKMVRQLFELSRQARVSLRDAIAVAERRHDGSRTVKVGFDRSASPCYRVRTVRDDEIWETLSMQRADVSGASRGYCPFRI